MKSFFETLHGFFGQYGQDKSVTMEYFKLPETDCVWYFLYRFQWDGAEGQWTLGRIELNGSSKVPVKTRLEGFAILTIHKLLVDKASVDLMPKLVRIQEMKMEKVAS